MKTNRFILIVLGVLLLVAGVMPSQSQPSFTFKIPVDIQNLHPDVDKIRFKILLYDKPHGVRAPAVTTGIKVVNIGPSRSLVTTLTFPMNPKNPQKLKSYSCSLQFHNKKNNQWRSPNSSANTSSWYRLGASGATSFWYAL